MYRLLLALSALALSAALQAQDPSPLPPDHAVRIKTLMAEAKLTDKYDATDLTKLIVLGDSLLDADRIEDARTAYLQAGAIEYEAAPKVVVRQRLARIRAIEGDYGAAILIYRDVLAQMREAHATSGVRYNEPFQCHMCDVVIHYAEALVALGRNEEVLALPVDVVAIIERQSATDRLDPSNRRLPRLLSARASALEALGRWSIAEAERTRLWRMQRDQYGAASPLALAEAELQLAANLGEQGKTDQALALLETSIIAYRKLLPPLDPRLVAALGERGRVELKAAHRPADALVSLREATGVLIATGARDGKRQESRRRRFQSLFRLQVEAAWASSQGAAIADAPTLPVPAVALVKPKIRHGGPVRALAFLPDGSRLVSGSMDGSIILWDYRTKQATARFRDRKIELIDRITIIDGDFPIFSSFGAFGPARLWSLDGIATAISKEEINGARGISRDGGIVLGNERDPVLIDPKDGRRTPIETKAIPQNMVLMEDAGKVALTFRERDKTFREPEKHEICINSLTDGRTVRCAPLPSWSSALLPVPGGKQLLVGGEEIYVLDIASLEMVRSIRLDAFRTASAMALSPDKTLLAAAYEDGRAVLIDFAAGTEIARLEGHTGPLTAVAFSPDGETLATASEDTSIRLWSGKNGAALGVLGIEPRFARHAAAIKTARFFGGGDFVISGDLEGSIRVWEIEGGIQQAVYKTTGSADFAAASDQDKAIVTAGFSIEMRDRATGALLRTLPRHRDTSPVTETAITRAGYLMARDTDNFLDVFDPMGKRIGGTKLNVNDFPYLTASPANDIVAVTLFGERTELWNARTAKKIASLEDGVIGSGFSPDGTVFALISGWRPKTYEAATGKARYVDLEGVRPDLPYQQWRGSALCHTDGALFAFSQEKRFFYWPRLSILPEEIDPGAKVTALRCSPNGETLAAGLVDGDVLLIDTASGKTRSRLSGHNAAVTGFDISSNGLRLLSISDDRVIRVWDIATGTNIAALGE